MWKKVGLTGVMAARPAMYAACLALAVAACSSPDRQPASAAGNAEPVLGAWEYPASDYPAMCIAFLPGGQLQFRGGFLFFNPARWERHQDDGTVHLALGGNAPFPFQPAQAAAERRAGTAVRLLPERRTLVYRIDAGTASFDFGGFIFYRKAACSME